MAKESFIRRYKREIILGIAVAFFLTLVSLAQYALEPFMGLASFSDNAGDILLTLIELVLLVALAFMADRA